MVGIVLVDQVKLLHALAQNLNLPLIFEDAAEGKGVLFQNRLVEVLFGLPLAVGL